MLAFDRDSNAEWRVGNRHSYKKEKFRVQSNWRFLKWESERQAVSSPRGESVCMLGGSCCLFLGGGSVGFAWGVGGSSVGLSSWTRLLFLGGEILCLTSGREGFSETVF